MCQGCIRGVSRMYQGDVVEVYQRCNRGVVAKTDTSGDDERDRPTGLPRLPPAARLTS